MNFLNRTVFAKKSLQASISWLPWHCIYCLLGRLLSLSVPADINALDLNCGFLCQSILILSTLSLSTLTWPYSVFSDWREVIGSQASVASLLIKRKNSPKEGNLWYPSLQWIASLSIRSQPIQKALIAFFYFPSHHLEHLETPHYS